MPFNFFGKSFSDSLNRLPGWITGREAPLDISRVYNHLAAPVVRNATYDLSENMELIPVVLSHGMTAYTSSFYAYSIELAANGYIVFALNHNDGTCAFTTAFGGEKEIPFDFGEPLETLATRQKQLKQRE